MLSIFNFSIYLALFKICWFLIIKLCHDNLLILLNYRKEKDMVKSNDVETESQKVYREDREKEAEEFKLKKD